MSRVITEDDVLQHMEVPTAKGIFIVGCFENRVTLLSQQVRALNLVYALRSLERLTKGSRVAVVGGGVAGMTAAAAAAQVGCSVTLLEREQLLLPLLHGNNTRWLHPSIYDWPRPGSERDDAQLPLLTWTAGVAHEVAKQLTQQWTKLTSRLDIRTCLNVKDVEVSCEKRSSPHHVTWNDSAGARSGDFDAIFLAVGFGFERKVEGIHSVSYWDDDRLHQTSRNGHERYLISGCGDGGLIDLLRVRLLNFQHEETIRQFLSISSLPSLKFQLLDIEDKSRQESDVNAYIDEKYRSLVVPKEVDQFLESRLRKDVDVVLNGLERRPLNLQSSILNRLLVSRLLFHFGVRYRPGAFTFDRVGEQYKVQFRNGAPELFHHVVCRHGPQPSALERDFQDVLKNSRELRERNRLDQTREPLWPPGFFDVNPEAVAAAKPSVPEPSPVEAEKKTTGVSLGSQTVQEQASTTEREDPPVVSVGTSGPQRMGPVVASPVHEHLIGIPTQPMVSSPQAGKGRGSRTGVPPLNGWVLLVGVGVAWVLWKGNPPSAPVKPAPVSPAPASSVSNSASKVVRTPTNLSSSTGVRSPRPSVEDMGSLERVARGGTKFLSKAVPDSVVPAGPGAQTSPEVILANGRIDTVQQLRELRQIRLVPMANGERLTLDSSPRNIFGFISPFPNFDYGQSVVSQSQDTRGRSVEVHKLADGQLHLVGYVWDVESRAIATGRPVRVSFSPHPSGQSQSLVSVPFSRLRSVKIKDEPGPLVMDLDLGSSARL